MRIGIWGAGRFGIIAWKKLFESGNEPICFYDINAESIQNIAIDNHVIQVKRPNEASHVDVDVILMAFMSEGEQANSIENDGFKIKGILYGIIPLYCLISNYVFNEKISEEQSIVWLNKGMKPIIQDLQIHVVDNCNLNCKGCSHFSSIYDPNSEINIIKFEEDLIELRRNIDILHIVLLGGEPLLNKEIEKIIAITRKVFSDSSIVLFTNGLLLKYMKPSFFMVCRDNRIIVSVSGYKPVYERKEEITELLMKYGITYSFGEQIDTFGKNLDLTGSADPNKAKNKCRQAMCHIYKNGKIFKCPFSAYANRLFEKYNIDIRFDEGVGINMVQNWKETIRKLDIDPIDACRYCGDEQRFLWETQSNPELNDWII